MRNAPAAFFFPCLVGVPPSRLIAGTTLAFTRALGDFGATLMVAGDTPGQTQTMPLALYDAVQSGDAHTAAAFAALSAVLCLTVCVLAARLGR